MKPTPLPLAMALALVLATTAGCSRDSTPSPASESAAPATAATTPAIDPLAAEHAEELLHGDDADVPVPADHVRWKPDAPLVAGMSQVRTAIAGLEGQPDAATVAARADDIDAAIKFMFANCKLEPTPDTALHGVLARMMQASQALHASPADLAPLHELDAALKNYERMFDDPNHAAG